MMAIFASFDVSEDDVGITYKVYKKGRSFNTGNGDACG